MKDLQCTCGNELDITLDDEVAYCGECRKIYDIDIVLSNPRKAPNSPKVKKD